MSRSQPAPPPLAAFAKSVSEIAQSVPLLRRGGRVLDISPSAIGVTGLDRVAQLGDRVELLSGADTVHGEIIRIDASGATVKPFETGASLQLGSTVWHCGPLMLRPDMTWKGRVIDANAAPLDGLGVLPGGPCPMTADREPPTPLQRRRIDRAVPTGVRVVDLFTPLTAGQRMGIFAGSGVGKSTLLAMLARALSFDTVVVALVGERGREVREFLEALSPETRARMVAVISTGDQNPMMRQLAPRTAMTVAEFFRDQGDDVLLVIDSVTRYAHACREVALAAGEPPVARGYTPSVFSNLPKLLERAGPGLEGQGTITGLFTVLVDGDDHNDPVADSIRGTLDGHIVLARSIAEQGRYPAVDPLSSVSRLAHVAWTPEQRELAMKLRGLISTYEDTRDLRLIGGYRAGADAMVDRAIALVPKLYDALTQRPEAPPSADTFGDVARALQS